MYAGMHPDPLDPDFETLDLPRVAAGTGTTSARSSGASRRG